jgi:hypothetical protein
MIKLIDLILLVSFLNGIFVALVELDIIKF